MNSEYYDHTHACQIIENYCKTNRMNEADLATLIGIQPASLSRIKAGKGCSIETLAKIGALGGVSVKDLLFDTSEAALKEIGDIARANNLSVAL